MDKYQEYIIKKCKDYCFVVYADDSDDSYYNQFIDDSITLRQFSSRLTEYNDNTYRKDVRSIEKIIIKQSEDINKTKYLLFVHCSLFSNLFYIKDNKKIKAMKKSVEGVTAYAIQLDFSDRIYELKASIKGHLVDEITIPIEYVEADKEAYYSKIEKQRKEELFKNASIKHSTGADLVNIYFQPCSIDYDRTELNLYFEKNLIAKYKVDKDMFFKSITGLAYGKYFYIVTQYDIDGKVLLQTEKIEFSLNNPYNRKSIVTWSR